MNALETQEPECARRTAKGKGAMRRDLFGCLHYSAPQDSGANLSTTWAAMEYVCVQAEKRVSGVQ